MDVVATRCDLERIVRRWKAAGEVIALVPTMGGLHGGHLRLIDEARRGADRVVVSIFVNPMQFNDPADLDSYPRTLDGDTLLLRGHCVDLLFAPDFSEVYPHGIEGGARVEVPGLSEILCGRFRPGHFTGVATVVAILFNIVRPDKAMFGSKDYQQLLVIRRMVDDLAIPVGVVAVDTVRDADGLALSSRNGLLSAAQRATAPELYHTLCALRDQLRAGEGDYRSLVEAGGRRLEKAGFRPEYVDIRRMNDLSEPGPGDHELILLAAAWLGDVRLIDNLPV